MNGAIATARERTARLAQIEKAPVEGQHGVGILALRLDINAVVVFAQRKPWSAVREAGLAGSIPRHRSAARISTQSEAGNVLLIRVLDPICRDSDVPHTYLVAVVHGRRSPQGQEQHGSDTGLGEADPRRYPRVIMIPEYPVWPTSHGQRRFVSIDQLGNRSRSPRCPKQLKIERHLNAVEIDAVVGDQTIDR